LIKVCSDIREGAKLYFVKECKFTQTFVLRQVVTLYSEHYKHNLTGIIRLCILQVISVVFRFVLFDFKCLF